MELIDRTKLEPHQIYDEDGWVEVVYMDDIREMPTIEPKYGQTKTIWAVIEQEPLEGLCEVCAICTTKDIAAKQVMEYIKANDDYFSYKIEEWEIVDDVKETCNCWHPECISYIGLPQCWGTKEKEGCNCGGDKSKCDFYDYIRNK